MWRMLDPNLRRTWASEALGNISFCSFSTDCRVNQTQVAPASRSVEAFYPWARGCLLILQARASYGSDPIKGPGA